MIYLFFMALSLSAMSDVCAPEIFKFCPNIPPGKGQLALCLEENKDGLSKECLTELKSFQAKTQKGNPCFTDLSRWCVEVPPSPAKLEMCLLKNESKLTDKCAIDFKKNKPEILKKNICAQDVVNHCYMHIADQHGMITRCLWRNQKKLSPQCQKNTLETVQKIKKNNPCFDDAEKFCPTKSHPAEIEECLETQLTKLQPLCKKRIETEISKSLKEPCYKDLKRHCRLGLPPSEQARCLDLNFDHLRNICQQHHLAKKKLSQTMAKDCESDRLKFCAKEPFKDGLVAKCLLKNKEKLSVACKKHFIKK